MKRIFALTLLLISCLSNGLAQRREDMEQPLDQGIGSRGRARHKQNIDNLIESYLQITAFRHQVLAQNVANINTPEYKADEVAIPKNIREITTTNQNQVRMLRTSDKHITNTQTRDKRFVSHKLQDPDEVKKNGNNVSLRQQVTKLSQNKNDHLTAIKIHDAVKSLYSAALGK